MLSSIDATSDSEELLKIFEIQQGIIALSEKIMHGKQLEDLVKLRTIVEKMDSRIIKIFQYEIKKPFIAILSNPDEWLQASLVEVINSVQQLIKKGLVTNLNETTIYYSALFCLLDVPTNELKGCCLVSEDLKLKLFQCAKLLLESFSAELINKILKRTDLHAMVGHSIHVCLNNSMNESCKPLACESVGCLGLMLKVFAVVDLIELEDHKIHVGDIFASFLPGVSIGVMKILTKDSTLPRKLIKECLETFQNLLKITMTPAFELDAPEKQQFVQHRSKDWFCNTLEKLEIVFGHFINAMANHPSSEIRKSFVDFSRIVLEILSKLPHVKHSWKLLEVILILLMDEDNQVRSNAEQSLKSFYKSELSNNLESMYSIQDKFYQVLTSATRKFQYMTQDQKETKLKLIGGYIMCLGSDGMNTFFLSESSKRRLFECFIHLASFKERVLVEEHLGIETNSRFVDENIPYRYPKKKFLYLDDEKSERYLHRCCVLLGSYVSSYGLVDYLVEISEHGVKNPSILFFLNSTIEGIKGTELLGELFNQYVSQLKNLTEEQLSDYKSLLALCLLTQGLAIIAIKYGPSKKYSVLLPALYPILANTASQNSSVADTSLIALKKFTIIFEYSNIRELIIDNIDYLLDYINFKLNHFEINRKACSVLKAIFSFTNLDILDYFEFTMNHILSTLDIFFPTDCENLVDALLIIVSFIMGSSPANNLPTVKIETKNERKTQAFKEMQDFFHSRFICETMPDEKVTVTPTAAEVKAEESEDKVSKTIPISIRFLIQILERCCHLLSNPMPKIQLKTMDIVIKGLQTLQPYEDELLPMAHKIWSPLLNRLRGSNLLILRKSFDCLTTMCNCSGGFLRSRTVGNVLPKLTSFIGSQRSQSQGQTDSSPYKFTMEYQIQNEILTQIGLICYNLNVLGPKLWPVIECLLPYLSLKQPLSLQRATENSLIAIYSIDPFSVNYFLTKFLEDSKETKQYEGNIRNLLQKTNMT